MVKPVGLVFFCINHQEVWVTINKTSSSPRRWFQNLSAGFEVWKLADGDKSCLCLRHLRTVSFPAPPDGLLIIHNSSDDHTSMSSRRFTASPPLQPRITAVLKLTPGDVQWQKHTKRRRRRRKKRQINLWGKLVTTHMWPLHFHPCRRRRRTPRPRVFCSFKRATSGSSSAALLSFLRGRM